MNFDGVQRLLTDAVAQHVTPAATIEVGCASQIHWQFATGALTYDDAPACTIDTIFDLASLTKVISTASLAMQAIDAGTLSLDTTIASIEPRWSGLDRAHVTIRHLLDHSSGLPAHVKLFESASGRDGFLERIVSQPLAFAPGTKSEYSDLGFILLGMLIERVLGRPLDQLFDNLAAHLDGPVRYCPPDAWRARTSPTEFDAWRGRLIQGEVHDENAAALGGVAGHAGLFGNARAVGSFAQAVLLTLVSDTWLARRETMTTFVQRSNVRGSSRALGWDTMLPTSSCGTLMSPQSIGHTGFTGTSLWIDPTRDLYVALLTNRVHPSRHNEGIQPLRRAVHDAVVAG